MQIKSEAPGSVTKAADWKKVLLFPVAIVVTAAIFTLLGLSGTSIGVTQPHNSSVIAGTPRPIRSDEWNVATPLVVAQSHHGFPSTTQDSVGSHNLDVILDIPTSNWTTVFRPWDYGFFVFNVTHAFAARWWTYSALLILGAYALIFRLTRRVATSALFSLAMWLSPFFHWWYEAISLATVGLGMIALSAFLFALDARKRWQKTVLLALAAWALVAFAILFYPPFQIPIVILLVCVGLADLWTRHGSLRQTVRSFIVPLSLVAGASLVVLLIYYAQNSAAIHLIENTYYPGERRDIGGNTSLLQFFSAPYGFSLAKPQTSDFAGTNGSEISSFLLVGPYILFQLLRMRGTSLLPRARAILIGCLVPLMLFMLWYFIGLPTPLAELSLLDRVPAPRSIIGIGVAGMLLAAVFAASGSEATSRSFRPSEVFKRSQLTIDRDLVLGACASGLVAFVVTFWSGDLLSSAAPQLKVGSHHILAISLVMAIIVFLVAGRRPVIAGAAMVAMGAVVSLPANPLYRGLAPYTSTESTGVFTDVPAATTGGWISFAGIPTNDVLIASGLTTVNAVSFYPNFAAWRVLDPSGLYKDEWDRYANLNFEIQPGEVLPRFVLLGQDAIEIFVDPCAGQLSKLGVKFVVTGSPAEESCLVHLKTSDVLGTKVFIYRIQLT